MGIIKKKFLSDEKEMEVQEIYFGSRVITYYPGCIKKEDGTYINGIWIVTETNGEYRFRDRFSQFSLDMIYSINQFFVNIKRKKDEIERRVRLRG